MLSDKINRQDGLSSQKLAPSLVSFCVEESRHCFRSAESPSMSSGSILIEPQLSIFQMIGTSKSRP